MSKDHNALDPNTMWHKMMTDGTKSSMLIDLRSMADRNILGFIAYNRTTSRELRQSIRVRVTETIMLERCGGDSSSKGVVCGCLRRMCGRKTDGVQ
jgi:hypothetical protein